MNAASKNPEYTGLTHPTKLIQGYSGPEFETLGDLECD